MTYGIYLSAAGAHAQNHRLEVIANNLANVNTPGFKPHLAMLQARHSEAILRGEVSPGSRGIDDLGGGVQINSSQTSLQLGSIEQTKRKTDFALNDKDSFFVVQRGDQQYLTRAGGFVVNSTGHLTNTNGDYVLSTDGQPLRIDPSRSYETANGGTIQQGEDVRALMVVKAREPGDLTRVGDNLFQSLTPTEPIPTRERQVVAGHLEKSAVSPTTAMMELIEASRLYEANLRMIQHQDQALGNLVGRILRE
jgi:flagellar basal-body rod protein FlgF